MPANNRDRHHPNHGVQDKDDRTTVVFVTVATVHRLPWLATEEYHQLLHNTWLAATHWLVGPYLMMPDHLHFFAARGMLDYSLESWMTYWKREFSQALHRQRRLQTDHWDTRIRNGADFTDKWNYVQANPVRKGLCTAPEDWLYCGTVHEWMYMGP